MTPTREDTPRVSIATLRTQFKPSTYRAMTRVTLDHAGVASEVRLTTIEAHGSVRAPQRRLVCPRCAKPVLVLGVVEGKGWVCAACGRWRSRDRPRILRHEPLDTGGVAQPNGRDHTGSEGHERVAKFEGDRDQEGLAIR